MAVPASLTPSQTIYFLSLYFLPFFSWQSQAASTFQRNLSVITVFHCSFWLASFCGWFPNLTGNWRVYRLAQTWMKSGGKPTFGKHFQNKTDFKSEHRGTDFLFLCGPLRTCTGPQTRGWGPLDLSTSDYLDLDTWESSPTSLLTVPLNFPSEQAVMV